MTVPASYTLPDCKCRSKGDYLDTTGCPVHGVPNTSGETQLDRIEEKLAEIDKKLTWLQLDKMGAGEVIKALGERDAQPEHHCDDCDVSYVGKDCPICS